MDAIDHGIADIKLVNLQEFITFTLTDLNKLSLPKLTLSQFTVICHISFMSLNSNGTHFPHQCDLRQLSVVSTVSRSKTPFYNILIAVV